MSKKSATQALILLSLALFCFPSPAIAQKPRVKPVMQVTAVDSRGKIVGQTVGGLGVGDWPVRALIAVDERPIVISVTPNVLLGLTVYFDSADCLGTSWILAPSESQLFPSAGLGPPGNSVFLPRANAAPQNRNYPSAFSGGQCHAGPVGLGVPTVPADSLLIDLNTVFTPPFSGRTSP